MAAWRWYIDTVREAFARGKYENVELAGFYWLRETAAQPEDTEYSYHLTRFGRAAAADRRLPARG